MWRENIQRAIARYHLSAAQLHRGGFPAIAAGTAEGPNENETGIGGRVENPVRNLRRRERLARGKCNDFDVFYFLRSRHHDTVRRNEGETTLPKLFQFSLELYHPSFMHVRNQNRANAGPRSQRDELAIWRKISSRGFEFATAATVKLFLLEDDSPGTNIQQQKSALEVNAGQ